MEAVLSIFGFEIPLHGKAAIIVTAIFGAVFAVFFFIICGSICGCSCPCRRRRNRWRSYTTSTPARTTTIASRITTTTATASATATANNAATNSSIATNANGSGAAISPRVLASIPSFVYTSATDDDKLECTICLVKFKEGEKGKLLTCGHRFHAECIDKWFKSHSTCPVCRSEVRAETSELPV